MKFWLFLFFTLLLVIPQTGKTAAKEQYLRRVSILLTGIPPKYEDIVPVQNMNDSQFKQYLQKMILQYFESDLFNEKMRLRILELLQLKIAPRTMPELYYSKYFYFEVTNAYLSTQANNSVLDQYLIDLIKSNKNWNYLLTGNNYKINLLSGSAEAELDFYQDVLNDQPRAKSPLLIDVSPSQDKMKQALAGVITTPRFFERYTATKNAKNRLFARAIYKIFLCDDINIERQTGAIDRNALLNISLNNKQEAAAKNFVTNNKAQLCVNCETKLDLLGKVLEQSITRPSLEKSAGSINYVNKANNARVNVNFESLAQMALAITKQKKFLSCQVDHFWNWFVGSDFKSNQKELLAKYFHQENRQPKSLIKKILIDHFDDYKLQASSQNTQEVTFDNTYNRSMQNFDFYEAIRFQFNLSNDFMAQCRLQKIDLASLGLLSLQTGARAPLSPTMAYYQILYKCTKQLAQMSQPLVKVTYTQDKWQNSSASERRALTTEVINNILGPNLYSEERLLHVGDQIFSVVEALLEKQKQKNNLTLAINTIASYVVLTPEYLYL